MGKSSTGTAGLPQNRLSDLARSPADVVMAVFGIPIPSITQEEIAKDAIAGMSCVLNMGTKVRSLNRLLTEVREKVKGEGGKGRKIPFAFDLFPFPSRVQKSLCKRSNQQWQQQGLLTLARGVGIATGPVVSGSVGFTPKA